MSNNNTVVKQLYVCDGVDTTFAIPFFFLEGEESTIKVYLVDDATEVATLLTIITDYTLNVPATEVTTTTAYPAGNSILIRRISAKTQLSEFIQGPFPFEAVEEQFDRVISLVQETADDQERFVRVGLASPLTELEIPPADPDTILGWNAAGDALENKTLSSLVPSLPSGGATDAALTKASATDGDAIWDDLVFSGFSSRFNVAWSSAGLRDFIEQVLAITYLGPLIASFSGSSNTLREKGATVSGITLTVSVTRRSNLIAQIVFNQSGTPFETLAPPAQTGTGSTSSSIAVTPFSDNMTFSVNVTDAVVGPDGGNTVSSSTTYSFVYPYYHGAAAPGQTPAQVATLTKTITTENTNYNRSFTTLNGDVYYFAYPASYGNLTSILDENGFETFSAWTGSTSNITGLDATAVSYRIYESNNPVVAGSTNFTFRQ